MLCKILIGLANRACPWLGRGFVISAICVVFGLPVDGFAASAVTTLHTFTGPDGGLVTSSLVQASDGNYYGASPNGGDTSANSGIGYGTVFEMSPSGTVTVLHTFTGTDGSGPNGLAMGPDGNLYGGTQQGGVNNAGTIFRITPSGTLTTLYSFPRGPFNGNASPSRLTLGNDGNFYGVTQGDGANWCGSIFRVTSSGTLTTLYSFPSGAGIGAQTEGLVLAADGNFYGIAGSSIFKITSSGVITTVHNFATGEGVPSNQALLQGTDGLFYGTTINGGSNGVGSVFSLSSAGTLTILYSFSPIQGSSTLQPGGLIEGGDGSFYGTTEYGGQTPCSCGQVYKITQSGALTILYYFDNTSANATGPARPVGGLYRGSDGFLYGSASNSLYRYDSTSPPEPYITITASPTRVTLGSSSVLTWSVINATSCTASGSWSGASIATSGSQSVTPTAIGSGSSGYTLNCTGPGGNATATAAVNVVTAASISLSVTPSTITLGDVATLKWMGTATASNCTATGAWSGSQPSAGSQMVSPTAIGPYFYYLTCPAAAGGVYVDATATLTVVAATSAPPPAPPTINFSANPTSIVQGQSTSLTWSTSGATSCTGANAWAGSMSTNGTQSVSPASSGGYQYDLTCAGTGGATTASVSIVVAAQNSTVPPSPPPTLNISLGPTSITLGQTALLSWSASNATGCTQSNGWNGSVMSSGSQNLIPTATGEFTYVLTCTGAGGSIEASTILEVTGATSDSGSTTGSSGTAGSSGASSSGVSADKGGGGAFGLEDLFCLALVGVVGHRKRWRAKNNRVWSQPRLPF